MEPSGECCVSRCGIVVNATRSEQIITMNFTGKETQMARDADTIQGEINNLNETITNNESKIKDLKDSQDDLECEISSAEDSIRVLEDELENLPNDDDDDSEDDE